MSHSKWDGRKDFERERQLLIRTAMLDLMWCVQHQQPPNERMQNRIAMGWDAVKLGEDTPLRFFDSRARVSNIILPIGPTQAQPGF
jgi:hypothetical protein